METWVKDNPESTQEGPTTKNGISDCPTYKQTNASAGQRNPGTQTGTVDGEDDLNTKISKNHRRTSRRRRREKPPLHPSYLQFTNHLHNPKRGHLLLEKTVPKTSETELLNLDRLRRFGLSIKTVGREQKMTL